MKVIMPFRAVCAFPLALLVFTTPAAAQQKGAIIGEILDAVDGAPLMKVIVTIQGTKLKAVTDSLGAFRIEGVEAGEVTIRFQKAGYASLAEPVVVHDGWTTGVRFELAPTKVLLDALRVQAGGTRVPADVAGGKRAEVRPTETTGAPSTMLDAIGTNVPGVMVMKPSGEVGRGSRVMIRGPSSISLSNLPLVYLDGIRVQAEQFGIRGRGLLSLDFIDPQSIDRIEVLRGPAAAAQFGGEASAGVIMVYTKRGGGR